MTALKVLGVDVAFRRTGWALLGFRPCEEPVLETAGHLRPKGTTRGEALVNLRSQFRQVLEQRVDLIVLEHPGYWMKRSDSNRHSVEMLAMARGVLLVECVERQLPTIEVDFAEACRAVLGTGAASKQDAVAFLAQKGFSIPRNRRGNANLDITDSIILALYGLLYARARSVAEPVG